MRRTLAILAVTTLVACSGDDTTTQGDDDDDATCANSILGQFPENADQDVYYRTDVRFTLAAEDGSASIAVTDSGGAAVTGSTSVDGTVVTWSGDPLTPDTDYNVTLTYECGDATVTWKTSSTGNTTTTSVIDMVYDLDLASGEWVEPAGVGDLLATQLGDVQILVMPTQTDPELILLGALGDTQGNQEICDPTIPFPPAAYTDPYFEVTSPLLTLDVAGFVVDVQDLELSGAFSPDASRIQGAVLKGNIDTRPLVELIAPGGDDNAVCDLVLTFGVPCEDCGTGEIFCLSLDVQDIAAGQVTGVSPLVERLQPDIDADPLCK